MKRIALWTLLVAAMAAPTRAWTPNECGVDYWPKVATFRKELLAAKPGSHLFTPHPYPQTDQEVFEDFVATYSAIWQNTEEAARPSEVQQLFTALKNGTMAYKISTVEDWGNQRCLLLSPTRLSYLVELYDKKTGTEFARATVKETGLWATFQAPPPGTPADAVKLFQAEVEAFDHAIATAASYGLPGGEAPQYVETAGTLRCPQIAPCVAFRVGKSIVISKRGQLFEVTSDSRRFTGQEFSAASPGRDSILRSLDPANERVVSLGADQFAVARLVGGGKKAKR
jgi:hypothetical protein